MNYQEPPLDGWNDVVPAEQPPIIQAPPLQQVPQVQQAPIVQQQAPSVQPAPVAPPPPPPPPSPPVQIVHQAPPAIVHQDLPAASVAQPDLVAAPADSPDSFDALFNYDGSDFMTGLTVI